MEHLDELVLLELGLGILVRGQSHVDGDVHHAQVRVAEAGVCQSPGQSTTESGTGVKKGDRQTIEHDGRRLQHLGNVARLLLQLADGGLLGGLAGVDQAGGELDDDLVDGGAVLFLEDDLGAWEGITI